MQGATGGVALRKSCSGMFQRLRGHNQYVAQGVVRKLNLGLREIFAPISRQLYPDLQKFVSRPKVISVSPKILPNYNGLFRIKIDREQGCREIRGKIPRSPEIKKKKLAEASLFSESVNDV